MLYLFHFKVTKKMRVSAFDGGKGFFISLQVISKIDTILSTSLSAPVTLGEYKVIQRLLDYSLPMFLGFDAVLNANSGFSVPSVSSISQNIVSEKSAPVPVSAYAASNSNSYSKPPYSKSRGGSSWEAAPNPPSPPVYKKIPADDPN